MGEHLFAILRQHFNQHGYLTVAVMLLLENAGVPVPGETVLLLAGFLSFSEHNLRLPYVILVGIVAATLGDNLGYIIGHRGGRRLLERHRRFFHVSEEHFLKAERLFQRYGTFTVFFARFVFGMRILTGPLAGVLGMPWKKFVLFNFLGATLWVTVIASLGYVFGRNWDTLIQILKRADLVIAAAVLVAMVLFWLRSRRGTRQNSGHHG